jgi:hypothetical protein
MRDQELGHVSTLISRDRLARSGTITVGFDMPVPVSDRWSTQIRTALRARIRRSSINIRLPAISRGRLGRIMFASAVLVAGGAIYVPQLLYTTSSEAILNARVITLDAPIDGHIVNPPPPEGTVVPANTSLLTIANPNIDASHLSALEAERTKASSELNAARQLTTTLDTELARLDKQMSSFRTATVERLGLSARQAQADAVAARASAVEAEHNAERKRALRDSATVSLADADRAEQAATRTAATAESARLAAERLAGELAAARQGVYISEDRNDVPYSEQRTDEFRVRRAEAAAQENSLAARIAQLDKQVADEQARVKRLSAADVHAPVSGVVWRPLITTGSPVGRDSEMLTLIDCSEIYATATLSGRRFDDLRPGGAATVRLLGSDIDYAATIVDVRAMRRSDAEERFAAPLPALDGKRILAIVKLNDPRGLASDKYCNVGRRIEVRFAAPSTMTPPHVG